MNKAVFKGHTCGCSIQGLKTAETTLVGGRTPYYRDLFFIQWVKQVTYELDSFFIMGILRNSKSNITIWCPILDWSEGALTLASGISCTEFQIIYDHPSRRWNFPFFPHCVWAVPIDLLPKTRPWKGLWWLYSEETWQVLHPGKWSKLCIVSLVDTMQPRYDVMTTALHLCDLPLKNI